MSELSGTRAILAMDLRRDKIVLPVCVATFAAVAAGSAAATIGLFPDEASRLEGAELINLSAALVAMYGRVYDPTSIGALSMIKMIGMGTVAIALFAVMIMVRHTRADEELGRHELLSGGSLGRGAPLAAALLVATGTSVIIGLATALALVATGLPIVGSFTFGLCWTVSGLAFAGVGAVAAQLAASARAARGLAVGVLGGRSCCGRSATPPVARTPGGRRGCRRSAGPSRSDRSPATAWRSRWSRCPSR